jgi:hypothetical protein
MMLLLISGMTHSTIITFSYTILLIFAKTKTDRVTLTQVWNRGNIKLNLKRGVTPAMRVEKG